MRGKLNKHSIDVLNSGQSMVQHRSVAAQCGRNEAGMELACDRVRVRHRVLLLCLAWTSAAACVTVTDSNHGRKEIMAEKFAAIV